MTPVRKKGYLHGVIEFCSEIALTKTLVPDTAFLCDLQKQQFPCMIHAWKYWTVITNLCDVCLMLILQPWMNQPGGENMGKS